MLSPSGTGRFLPLVRLSPFPVKKKEYPMLLKKWESVKIVN
jgi:hypothetical protein